MARVIRAVVREIEPAKVDRRSRLGFEMHGVLLRPRGSYRVRAGSVCDIGAPVRVI